jgi:putative sterol carrier protein
MSIPQTAREIMLHIPERFKAAEAGPETAIFHFVLEGETGGNFTVKVDGGKCTAEEGLVGEPECVITSAASDFEDAELGRVNRQMAVMMGKIRISNLGSMLKFISMFEDLPTA